MTDEFEDIGQGDVTPPDTVPEGQADETPEMYDFGGKQMTLEQAAQSYAEAQRKISEQGMTNAELQRQLESRSVPEWVPGFEERYKTDEAFAKAVDQAWSGGQTASEPPPYSPVVKKLQQFEVKLQQQEWQNEVAAMRNAGKQISPEDERAIYTELNVNPNLTPSLAYAKLFYERDMQAAKREATTKTAEHMAESGSYTSPPSGTQKKSKQSMTSEEREKQFMEDLAKIDYGTL